MLKNEYVALLRPTLRTRDGMPKDGAVRGIAMNQAEDHLVPREAHVDPKAGVPHERPLRKHIVRGPTLPNTLGDAAAPSRLGLQAERPLSVLACNFLE
ncbi:hypothetical protein LZC95_20335 [Pendulispora brunnea]|uniref:Uncharacterized protein n=1 Tax=Pendulispora brunnea TaxID=2905690 RepID=A0ABZ2KP93_9BACT